MMNEASEAIVMPEQGEGTPRRSGYAAEERKAAEESEAAHPPSEA